jgi:hypothetical protein
MINYPKLLDVRQRFARVRSVDVVSAVEMQNIELYLRWRAKWERGVALPDAHPISRPRLEWEWFDARRIARAWLATREVERARERQAAIKANPDKVLVLRKRPARIKFRAED